MPDPTYKPQRERSQLVFGLLLVLFGALLLAHNLGLVIPFRLWNLWPLPLIAFGVLGLLAPSRHLERSGGLWLFTVGVYGAIGTYGWLGLDWFRAAPVFVIAAGISVIFNRRRVRRDPSQVTHEA
jgi:hypothetical protein